MKSKRNQKTLRNNANEDVNRLNLSLYCPELPTGRNVISVHSKHIVLPLDVSRDLAKASQKKQTNRIG